MKRILLAVLVAGSITAAPPAHAQAKRTTGATTYTPSPTAFSNFSKCDDGGGAAVCVASAFIGGDGFVETEARLWPAQAFPATGRAEGRGGHRVGHRLTDAYSAVRYRFYFHKTTAYARKDPVLARDIEARVFVVGHVSHASCDACTAQVSVLVADSDPLSPAMPEVHATYWNVDVEVRNPGGKVPPGWTYATGYLLSDVARYQDVPAFTSRGDAVARGGLMRLEVEPIL